MNGRICVREMKRSGEKERMAVAYVPSPHSARGKKKKQKTKKQKQKHPPVLGTMSLKSSITTRPAGLPSEGADARICEQSVQCKCKGEKEQGADKKLETKPTANGDVEEDLQATSHFFRRCAGNLKKETT